VLNALAHGRPGARRTIDHTGMVVVVVLLFQSAGVLFTGVITNASSLTRLGPSYEEFDSASLKPFPRRTQ
jgi:hypothetical protein